jgi:hypothetical protein
VLVTDIHGNFDACSFTVTVIDNIDPTLTCKPGSPFARIVDPYQTYYTVVGTEFDATASDACGVASLKYAIDGGAQSAIGASVGGITLNIGSHNIVWTAVDVNGNSSTCTTVVNVGKRPTTLTNNGVYTVQYSDLAVLSATLTDNTSGSGISGKTITFTIGSQSTTAVTNASGIATTTTTIIVTQPAGSYSIVSSFTADATYLGSTDTDPFTITKENACATYSGPLIQATTTPSSGAFSILLSFSVFEDGGAGDVNYGNISLAQARIMNGATDLSGWLPINLNVPGNYSMGGNVSFTWSGNIGTNTYEVYDISLELNVNSYYSLGCNPTTPITIYKNTGDFITGGGYIIEPSTAAGVYAPQTGEHTNFGFNVKFNKKGTALQGKMTVVFRHVDGGILKTYQIKTNSMTSLGVQNNPDPTCDIAVFNSKATLKDVSNPLAPISLGGNLDLHVTMTDCGEPGTADAIGITLWGPGNVLWVSTSWINYITVEEVLDGGNLVVHSGFSIPIPQSEEAEPPITIIPSNDPSSLLVYPNPYIDKVTFQFVPESDTRARLELYDLTGRLVETLYEGNVTGGQKYEIEYLRTAPNSNILIYRMTMGDKVSTGKLLRGNF